ncbi:hypothetical protein PGB90_004263 [Kerria lacca]
MVIVTFVHLDLGIGGAERLVVDAAVALKQKNHRVNIITSHHDKSHCFPETVNGTIPITVIGDWLPRTLFGKFSALCSYIRMIYISLYLIFFNNLKPDVVICDQVSVCIPILRLKTQKTIYYCHFPDLLLSKSGTTLKQLYRIPLNYLEEKTTNMANIVLVNSEFTKYTLKSTFKNLIISPKVLYPSINNQQLDQIYHSCDTELYDVKINEFKYFLSINRYERKKNISIAIEAFTLLLDKLNSNLRSSLKLIIAGGYDLIVEENIEYFKELKQLVENLKINEKVIFLKSPTEAEKIKLIKNCEAVLYTPDNEHFGIVPLEAMFCKKAVIAVNSGGPKETIIHGKTGLLCSASKESFCNAMFDLITNDEFRNKLGEAAKERFENIFSYPNFKEYLSGCLIEIILSFTCNSLQKKKKKKKE